MSSVRRRLCIAAVLLLVLFSAMAVVQGIVASRATAADNGRAARLMEWRDDNGDVLQALTDAETGVGGFLLTGRELFLQPYRSGIKRTSTGLAQLRQETAGDGALAAVVAAQQAAADRWLSEYAQPAIAAGTIDTDPGRAERGKQLFDDLRQRNTAIRSALDAQLQAAQRDTARTEQLMRVLLAGLGLACLLCAVVLAAVAVRQVLLPLDRIRTTLARLSGGDLAARAEPVGPAETRTVITMLNELAAQTERMLHAEQAQVGAGQRRQAAVAAIRSSLDPAVVIATAPEHLAHGLLADAVHLTTVHAVQGVVTASWPQHASPPPVGDEDPRVLRTTVVIGEWTVILSASRQGLGWTASDFALLAALGDDVAQALYQADLYAQQQAIVDQLTVLDGQKELFMSTASHELRTPLANILGYAELLTETGGLAGPQQRAVAAIGRNAQRLHTTIEDLFLLTMGRLSDLRTRVDLTTALAAAADELAPVTEAKQVQLTVDAPAVIWVDGDTQHLNRVVAHLLSNAVKFSHTGGQVHCTVSADTRSAVVAITDTGIGIPEADMPGLFTAFHRAGNAVELAVQGSGLGLAIARTVAERHGGTVTIRSLENAGTTVTLTLPLSRTPHFTDNQQPLAPALVPA